MNVENNSSDSHILGQYLEVINGQNRNVERTQVYSFFLVGECVNVPNGDKSRSFSYIYSRV